MKLRINAEMQVVWEERRRYEIVISESVEVNIAELL